jgi:hypothetical protein
VVAANTVAEFLVGLGFKIDESQHNRFRQGIGQAATATTALQKQIDLTVKALNDLGAAFKKTAEDPAHKFEEGTRRVTVRQLELLKTTKELGRTALETATVFAAGILNVAKNYEQLYYLALRTGTAAADLAALQAASRQAAGSGIDLARMLADLSTRIATMPGIAGIVKTFSGDDWDKTADKGKVLLDTLEGLRKEYAKGGGAAAIALKQGRDFFGFTDQEMLTLFAHGGELLHKMQQDTLDAQKRAT